MTLTETLDQHAAAEAARERVREDTLAELIVVETYNELRSSLGHDYGNGQRRHELTRRRREAREVGVNPIVAEYAQPHNSRNAKALRVALEAIVTPRERRLELRPQRRYPSKASDATRVALENTRRLIELRIDELEREAAAEVERRGLAPAAGGSQEANAGEALYTAAVNYRHAERSRRAALADRQAHWRIDPDGRRSRGALMASTRRAADRALARLLEAERQAPAELADVIRNAGPTRADAVGAGHRGAAPALEVLRRRLGIPTTQDAIRAMASSGDSV